MAGLASYFCWTKYGTEAGEDIRSILARKERERLANDGVFLWGVGNSIVPSLRVLLTLDRSPDVVFTPMLSRPSSADRWPPQVARWRAAMDMDGVDYALPPEALVTSRFSPGRLRHFALVCHSDQPIGGDEWGATFRAADVLNLPNGTRVGASQVTSVVAHLPGSGDRPGPQYAVGMVARLRPPYFLRLAAPVVCIT